MESFYPSWLQPLITPVVTILIGGIIVQRFFVRRANQAAFVDHIIKEISDLREESIKYWSLPNIGHAGELDVRSMEVRIKAKVHSLTSDLNFFKESNRGVISKIRGMLSQLSGERSFVPDQDSGPDYITSMLDVYDNCTGGDFESESRQPDISRCYSICSSISNLKSALLRLKL